MVASDTAHGHTVAWLARHTADADCTMTDVTADYGQLNVQGPLSRDVLGELTDADLSTDVFGFRTARWIELAGVEVLCVRITYLGELGYELYVPAADTLRVYDALLATGSAHGLRPVGLKALASLRMEKGYRDFGHDIDNTDCPLEAGLGFALALDKPGGFVGRDAVVARKLANAAAGGMSSADRADPGPGSRPPAVPRGGPPPRRCGGRLRPGGVLRLDARRGGRSRHGLRRWRAGHPRLDQGRKLGCRHRRHPVPGRGVAASDVRPDLGSDQGLSALADARRPPVSGRS